MGKRWIVVVFCLTLVLFTAYFACNPNAALDRAMESITEEELAFHLEYLAADEFKGRNTPSPELKIASLYIAKMAEKYGLQPLLSNGSFLQEMPLKVSKVSPARTSMRFASRNSGVEFSFPHEFGLRGRSIIPGEASGAVVFLGYGLQAPDLDWDDYKDIDLQGKIAVILDVDLPDDHRIEPEKNRRLLWRRSYTARQKGASAVLMVISRSRENGFLEKKIGFDNPDRGTRIEEEAEQGGVQTAPFYQLDVRHGTAAAILGVSINQITSMFAQISQGKQVPAGKVSRSKLDISVAVNTRPGSTYNVVAWLEGSDPDLKDEYVLFGSHHDHLGVREGKVLNGADDNGSGTVAMLELAQALQIKRPRRSIIFVWHTAEEKGLWGSYHFLAHSPVPVEKMSAELNMDMICRNDPESLYLIGSNKLSSELDAIIHAVNDKYIKLNLDYTYEDPGHSDRFFFRSDQYPYIRYGVPGVWFFCGTTEDYHQETDTIDRVDYNKMARVTRLVYLTAMEIGNLDHMLKLDLHPEVKNRGKDNLNIVWR